MTVPMIVPCLNRFDMFTEMFETIDTPVHPFVIDCWRNNRGVSGAWNEGMRRARDAGYRYAVVANDDLKFEPGSLQGIYDTLIDTGAAAVSPNQQRLPRRIDSFEHDGIRAGADFFCFAIDIEQVTEEAGWFDQNFFPAYFEDNDMHHRMHLKGLTTLLHTDMVVIHEGSATQNYDRKNPNVTSVRFEAHRSYFDRKWGGLPGKTTFATPFNHADVTVRDWNGSYKLDGLETSAAQQALDSIDSLCYDVGYERY